MGQHPALGIHHQQRRHRGIHHHPGEVLLEGDVVIHHQVGQQALGQHPQHLPIALLLAFDQQLA